MDNDKLKLIAMDLDGTLTQHKSKLDDVCRDTLNKLSRHYRLVMVCAGSCERVYSQLEAFPIDIIGYYGMQRSTDQQGTLIMCENHSVPVDRELMTERVLMLRERLGLTELHGDAIEFHASGLVTFPLLGTSAPLDRKLAYDPDRSKRRSFHEQVKKVFKDYTVFIGGSSSFDIVPQPFNKRYALESYVDNIGISKDQVVFFGDDYGLGGNDENVYLSDIEFVCIDDYRQFPDIASRFL